MSIRLFGIGGGGGHVLAHLLGMDNVVQECLLADTCDLRQKYRLDAPLLLLGPMTLKGEGACGNPEFGAMAAEESRGDIERCLEGAGLLVLVAGLSGGTGSGATPVIARIAKEMGITTVAFVSTPDAFEGPVRARQTQKGLAKLREQVEALNVIPNRLAFQGRGDYETMLKNFDAYFRVTNAFNARVVAGYISALKAA